MNDDIVDLQTRLAFQDQQKQIDRLELMLAALKAQLETVQHTQMIAQSDEPPPPHY